MKGNYTLQVSKIKSHAKRMTYNRRAYPRYVRMIKAHDLYRKEMRTHPGGVPTEHKKSGTDAIAPVPDVYLKACIRQDCSRITPRCLI